MSRLLLAAVALCAIPACTSLDTIDTDALDTAEPVLDEVSDQLVAPPEAPPVSELASTHRQIVYVDFHGPTIDDCDGYCSNAPARQSWAIGEHFGRSSVNFAPYAGSTADRNFIVAHLVSTFDDYEIDIVTDEPEGNYTLLVVGQSSGPASGVAPLDCDNRNPGDIAFVYKTTSSRQWVAQAAAHELGHSFGLSHVTSASAHMHWAASGDAFTVANHDAPRAGTKCYDGDVQDAPAMLTSALGSRTPEAPTWDGTFSDDDGNIHESAIEKIAAAGITVGCSGGGEPRYCPSETVTRGQMVTFLQRGLGLPHSSTDHFSDDDGAWYEGPANTAADAGITMGCGSDRFCGEHDVTRDQMASFLARALDLPPSVNDHFDDDDGNMHESAINSIADAGITMGCGGTNYCPESPVTRDQMASFLARALDL